MNERQIARGLGWFSIGLGLAELLAPRKVEKTVGVRGHRLLTSTVGMRELASGIGLLSSDDPQPWLWSRVGGDVMDLGLLAAALSSGKNDRRRVSVALATIVGITALDVVASVQNSRQRNGNGQADGAEDKDTEVCSVTLNRPRQEVYTFWRNLENLPRFMPQLQSVTDLGNGRSHWVAEGPAGADIEWEAETTEDRPGEKLSWKSVGESQLDNEGTVEFRDAPGGRGTIVRVEFKYKAPGGMIGKAVAKVVGTPRTRLEMALGRFKQLLETGELARTAGQPTGRANSLSPKFDFARSV